MNFGQLDRVAFFVSRLLDDRAYGLVATGKAWAIGVRVGFPNYVEVWGQLRDDLPTRRERRRR